MRRVSGESVESCYTVNFNSPLLLQPASAPSTRQWLTYLEGESPMVNLFRFTDAVCSEFSKLHSSSQNAPHTQQAAQQQNKQHIID
jgi:hypothetical protein